MELVAVWVLGNNITDQWVSISNALNVPILALLNAYQQIYLEYTENGTTYYFNLCSVNPELLIPYSNSDKLLYTNLSDFLAANGNLLIIGSNVQLQLNIENYNLVNYHNLFDANYRVKVNGADLTLINKVYPISPEYVLNNCLITINGFIYPTELSVNPAGLSLGNDISVINGSTNFTKLIGSQLGVLDFSDIGTLSQFPFSSKDFINADGYYSNIKLALPSQYNPAINSVLVILNGYLNLIDGEALSISNGQLNINISMLNFVSRYLETSIYMPLSDLIVNGSEINYFPSQDNYLSYSGISDGYSELLEATTGYGSYNDNQIVNDQLIMDYINNTPCMIVLVNTPTIQSQSFYPQTGNFPGRIDLPIDPLYPLTTYTGRLVEYTKTKNENNYKLEVIDEVLKHLVFVGSNYYTNNTFYSDWSLTNVNYSKSTLTVSCSFLKLYTQGG
jgi:hypothetical protein